MVAYADASPTYTWFAQYVGATGELYRDGEKEFAPDPGLNQKGFEFPPIKGFKWNPLTLDYAEYTAPAPPPAKIPQGVFLDRIPFAKQVLIQKMLRSTDPSLADAVATLAAILQKFMANPMIEPGSSGSKAGAAALVALNILSDAEAAALTAEA